MCCPIGLDIFSDPVVAADGETYERAAIERWIADKKQAIKEAHSTLSGNRSNKAAKSIIEAGIRSPMGFGELAHFKLTPNRAMERLAREWESTWE
jgi:hypothetical protein